MYLERTGTLVKQSYILTKHVYQIPLSKLRPLSSQRFENRLSEESYSTLMKILKLEKSEWMPTEELESGSQDPSTFLTTLKAGLPTLAHGIKSTTHTPTRTKETSRQAPCISLPSPSKSDSPQASLPRKGKKGKKFMAAPGHDFLSNMACAFS